MASYDSRQPWQQQQSFAPQPFAPQQQPLRYKQPPRHQQQPPRHQQQPPRNQQQPPRNQQQPPRHQQQQQPQPPRPQQQQQQQQQYDRRPDPRAYQGRPPQQARTLPQVRTPPVQGRLPPQPQPQARPPPQLQDRYEQYEPRKPLDQRDPRNQYEQYNPYDRNDLYQQDQYDQQDQYGSQQQQQQQPQQQPQGGYFQNGYQGYNNNSHGYEQQSPYQNQSEFPQEQPYRPQNNGQYQDSFVPHPQHPQHPQHPSPGPVYQQDEASRPDPLPRPQMMNSPPLQERQEVGGKPIQQQFQQPQPPPQPVPHQRHKAPRERILREPESPKTLAWDNPFGVFPPAQKKAKAHRKHASLDKESISSSAHTDQRPHTSHGHQRPGNSKPNNSQGFGSDTTPLTSPALPADNMPLKKRPPFAAGPQAGPHAGPQAGAQPSSFTGPPPSLPPAGPLPTGPPQANTPSRDQDNGLGYSQSQPAPTTTRQPVAKYSNDGPYRGPPQSEGYNQDPYRGGPLRKPQSHPDLEPASINPAASQPLDYRDANPAYHRNPSRVAQPTPALETPVLQAPVHPVHQASFQLAPAHPVNQASFQQAPVHQAPVHQAPVHQAPVHQAPVHQASFQPAPVQPAPVQPAPVQPAPVQSAPVLPAAPSQPAYSKSEYQAYSTSTLVNNSKDSPPSFSEPMTSPLAEFSFDLPPSNPTTPPVELVPPSQAPVQAPLTHDHYQNAAPVNPPRQYPDPNTDQYGQQRRYEGRLPTDNQSPPGVQQAQSSANPFPAQGASRPPAQPRPALDEQVNVPPGPGRYRENPGQMPYRSPPNNQDPSGRANGYGAPPPRNKYDQGYNRAAQQYDKGYAQPPQPYDTGMPDQRSNYFAEGDGYTPRQVGPDYEQKLQGRKPLRDNYGLQQPARDNYGGQQPVRDNYGGQQPVRDNYGGQQPPPRPRTADSRHPPPMRKLGERTASFDHGAPSLPPPINGGSGDRPVPYRPGLVAANGRANGPVPGSVSTPVPTPASMAGPGYGSAPTPTPAAMAPQSRPPPSQRAQSASPPEDKKVAPVTVAELNSLRETFKNNPNDWGLGLRFAQRLVEASSVLASENGRADPKTTARNRERYIFDADKIIKKLVSAGSPEAMFYLADCYSQGQLGLAPDPKEAFSLYQHAAKLNHAQAAYRVAVCCELGLEEGGGTRRDPVKAMQWYRRAATLGDPPAMYKLGMILLKGLLGQQKNSREAVTWLKRAADRADVDNPHALHELALLYESAGPNESIIRDEGYSFQLFQQAADLGYKHSQFRLGAAYEYGRLGCPIDARQSITWYTKAAAQGEHQSELALSGWYLTGSEPLLQQSDREAYLWARKAASSGLPKAEYAMGYFTEVGIGTAPNLEEARTWYYRAAAQNFPKARHRLEEMNRGGPKLSRKRLSRTGRSDGADCAVM